MKDFDEIFDNLDRTLDKGMKTLDIGMDNLDKAMSKLDKRVKNMTDIKIKKSGGRSRIFIDGKEIKGENDSEVLRKSQTVIKMKMVLSFMKAGIVLILMLMLFNLLMTVLHSPSDKVAPLNPSTQQEQTTNEFKQL